MGADPGGFGVDRAPGRIFSADELHRRLGFHPATEATAPAYELNRALALTVADVWSQLLPGGREASLALTALQEALMWANAAVACNAGPDWTVPAPIEVAEHLDELAERLEGPELRRGRPRRTPADAGLLDLGPPRTRRGGVE